VKVAVILPRGMVFSPRGATSIDLVAHDLYQASRYKDTTYMVGAAVDEPFPATDFRPVDSGSQSDFTRKAEAQIKADLPDLIVVHQHPESAAALARSFPSIPVVLHRHGLMRHKHGWISKWRKGRALKPIHGFIFVSDFIRQSFLRTYPDLEPKTSIVFNGVNCKDWAPAAQKSQRVVYLGRAREDKGVALLLEAFKKASPPDWNLELILGVQTEAERAFADRIAASIAPDDPVTIRENLASSEVKMRLGSAAIATLPSIVEEGFPRAVVEAMACGCATLATASGGTPEAAGGAALLLHPSQPEVLEKDLADALSRLMQDGNERTRLSEAARQHVVSTLDLKAVASAYDACLEDHLHRHSLRQIA